MAYTVTGKFPNQVSGDPEGLSLVSGQNWDVVATVTNSGTPVGGHLVKVYDFDINTGASVLLGEGTTASSGSTAGEVNISCSPVYNVQGTDASRLIRLVDSTSGETQDYYIPIWFHVTMDVECPYPTVSQTHGYTSQTACGAQPAGYSFIALPAALTCGLDTYVYYGGKTITTPKEDTGPVTNEGSPDHFG